MTHSHDSLRSSRTSRENVGVCECLVVDVLLAWRETKKNETNSDLNWPNENERNRMGVAGGKGGANHKIIKNGTV